jgi:hypothetical protein
VNNHAHTYPVLKSQLSDERGGAILLNKGRVVGKKVAYIKGLLAHFEDE